MATKTTHPNYIDCTISCACGNSFKTRSTRKEIRVDICSTCHPFFTGKQKFVDAAGRIQRFQDKFQWDAQAAAAKKPKKGQEAKKEQDS